MPLTGHRSNDSDNMVRAWSRRRAKKWATPFAINVAPKGARGSKSEVSLGFAGSRLFRRRRSRQGGGGLSLRRTHRQPETRKVELALLRIPVVIRVWQHDWGQGAQPLDYDFRLIQLAQVRVTGSEKAVRRDPIRVLLSR